MKEGRKPLKRVAEESAYAHQSYGDVAVEVFVNGRRVNCHMITGEGLRKLYKYGGADAVTRAVDYILERITTADRNRIIAMVAKLKEAPSDYDPARGLAGGKTSQDKFEEYMVSALARKRARRDFENEKTMIKLDSE